MAIETIVTCDNCKTVKSDDRKQWYGYFHYLNGISLYKLEKPTDIDIGHLCSEQCYREYLTRFFSSPQSREAKEKSSEEEQLKQDAKEFVQAMKRKDAGEEVEEQKLNFRSILSPFIFPLQEKDWKTGNETGSD